MTALLSDLRYAWRTLLRTPGFVAVAVLSLAVGIGANTTIFSVVSGLLFRPLPVARPHEVVGLFTSDFSGPPFGASAFADYRDIAAQSTTLRGLAAHALQPVSLSAGGTTERLAAELVSANYFDVLEVRPVLGRGFLPDEGDPLHPVPVVVLSHAVWSGNFGADRRILGRSITLSGRSVTVVGVMPPGFQGILRGLRLDVWLPAPMQAVLDPAAEVWSRGNRSYLLTGRLKPGATVAAAQAEMSVLAERFHRVHPAEWTDVRGAGRRLTVLAESQIRISPPDARGPAVAGSVLLMVVVGLVLLVACANLAGLLLARAASRRREIAIRLALGATRVRLIRQFISESALVSCIGGGLGLLFTAWATRLLQRFQPPVGVPVRLELPVDARVLGFALGISLVTGVLLGLVPSLQASRSSLVPALKEESSFSGRPTRTRLREAFVIGQVALSFLLLIAAGLFLRSLGKANAIDPGFGARQGAMASVDLSLNGYPQERGRLLQRSALERLRGTPGIEAAAWTTMVPLALGGTSRRGMSIRGYTRQRGEDLEFPYAIVSDGYFETMQVDIIRGRALDERDRVGAPGAVVVNQTFARRFWPGADPLGKELSVRGPEGPFLTVVGVARDGKYQTMGEDPPPFVYFPLEQDYRPTLTLVARTQGDAGAAVRAVRASLLASDPDLPIFGAQTLGEHLALTLLPQRVAAIVLGSFGGVALLLATMGVYGIVAFSVSQRVREIGVRVALGAAGGDVIRLMVINGIRPVAIGVGVGFLAALAATRLLRSFLTGVSPTDPVTFAAVILAFLSVALCAALLPARRAARIDPLIALRAE